MRTREGQPVRIVRHGDLEPCRSAFIDAHTPGSDAKENFAIVGSGVSESADQDLEVHHEFWHEDMIWHGPPGFGDMAGLDGFRNEVLKPFYAAFPDYHVRDEIQVASGDWVSATGFLTGHHRGEWLGVPPTGRAVRVQYSDFWLVRAGKLSENWVMLDNFSLLQQIGMDPLRQAESKR